MSQEEKPEISKTPSVTETGTLLAVTETPEEIFVDVCGAVTHPGVYALEAGSRVFQAIEAAGGFLAEAAGNCINQAQVMRDGQQIYVPTKEEAEVQGWKPEEQNQEAEELKQPEQGKINLNTADLAALQTLSGIGEAKAQAILAYREEHGSFSSVEDLMNVPGIKEGTFLKIKDKLAVE